MTTHFPTLPRLLKDFMLAVILLSATSCRDTIEDLINELHHKNNKELPTQITITEPALFPEGVAFDKKSNHYLVSSITRGTIGKVDDEGNYEPFIEDKDFVSTIGIHVDNPHKRLLVCVADPNEGNLAALGIYDLRSGNRMSFTNLGDVSDDPGAPHFANDVTTDLHGNAYVTDSFYPVIYKVDPDGHASVFLKDNTFQPSAGAFGLNGIVFHPLGFLIVAFSETSTLYKVPLDHPEEFSAIEVDTPLNAPDGLCLSRNLQTLIVVNNAGGTDAGNVLALESDDLWSTAFTEGTFETGAVLPTTATQRDGAFYVLYAHLNELFSGDTSRDTFQITKVDF